MKAPNLPLRRPFRAPLDSFGQPECYRDAAFVMRLHWCVIVLTPTLTVLRGQVLAPAVWCTLGLFAFFTVGLRAGISLQSRRTAWPGLGYAILVLDLFFVTALVWARGSLVTDAYHFYYLVIVGSAVLFGAKASIGCAVAAGLLYGGILWADTGQIAALDRAGIRTAFFVMTGILAAHLSRQEQRHRAAHVEARRLLTDLQEAHTELKVYAREMSQRAVTDGLTGLFNHTYFHQRLDDEVNRSARYHRPLSLLMLDLDNFKNYNDAYGHREGDLILAQVARVVTDAVRKTDIVCRYGGEEFAVIMPETDVSAAQAAAERIRLAVAHAFVAGRAGPGVAAAGSESSGDDGAPPKASGGPAPARLTVSGGLATHPTHSACRLALVEAADRALYLSKRDGKNVVSTFNGGISVGAPV